MRLSFQERTYLVTGGGSGIGKGVAAGLVAAGASVMIIGRNADRLAAAVEEIESLDSDGGAVDGKAVLFRLWEIIEALKRKSIPIRNE